MIVYSYILFACGETIDLQVVYSTQFYIEVQVADTGLGWRAFSFTDVYI